MKRRPAAEGTDARVVVSPDQARALLAAISTRAPALHAYFAGRYFAGLRPAEAANLRTRDLTLPAPRPGACPPPPNSSRHSESTSGTIGTGDEGRLFVTRTGKTGRPVAEPFVRRVSPAGPARVLRLAREQALTPEGQGSPLARRPYDLRLACMST